MPARSGERQARLGDIVALAEFQEKWCPKCRTVLPAIRFYAKANRIGGLDAWCIDCAQNSTLNWRKRHPEKVSEYSWKSGNWRKSNPEKSKRATRNWYLRNREAKLARSKLWRQAHPEMLRKYARRYFVEAVAKLATGNPSCVKCGALEPIEIDHIADNGAVERQKIGRYGMLKRILSMSIAAAQNEYQLLCANCNRIKELKRRSEQAKKGIAICL